MLSQILSWSLFGQPGTVQQLSLQQRQVRLHWFKEERETSLLRIYVSYCRKDVDLIKLHLKELSGPEEKIRPLVELWVKGEIMPG